MVSKTFQKAYAFILLCIQMPLNRVYSDGTLAVDATGVPVPQQRNGLLRKTETTTDAHRKNTSLDIRSLRNQGNSKVEISTKHRRSEQNDYDDDDDDYDDDDDNDNDDPNDVHNELTLDYEPQREFKQHEYVLPDPFVEGYKKVYMLTASSGSENGDLASVYKSGGQTPHQNKTDNFDGDDDNDFEHVETGNNHTNQMGNTTLKENTAAALMRHEDPPQEREVFGDSIFPFQQADNVFETREHGQR